MQWHLAVGIVLGLGFQSASAATVTYTYTGTVYRSTDETGLFGGDPSAPDYDPQGLNGKTGTIVQTFDLTRGSRTTSDTEDRFNGSPGLIAFSVTIDGFTLSDGQGTPYPLQDTNVSLLSTRDTFEAFSTIHRRFYTTLNGETVLVRTESRARIAAFNSTIVFPVGLDRPFSVDFVSYGPDDYAVGGFAFTSSYCLLADCNTARMARTDGSDTADPQLTYRTVGLIRLSRLDVTVSGPVPVPLPASALLLAAALSSLAAAAGRRRRTG